VQFTASGSILYSWRTASADRQRCREVVRAAGTTKPIWLVVYVVAITLPCGIEFIWYGRHCRFHVFRRAEVSKPSYQDWRSYAATSARPALEDHTLAAC